jgi:hypothetical protein
MDASWLQSSCPSRDILRLVKSLQNIEQTIGNILGMSNDQEYEMNLFSIPLFNEIRGKPQGVIILVLSRAVAHHDIETFPLLGRAIQQCDL